MPDRVYVDALIERFHSFLSGLVGGETSPLKVPCLKGSSCVLKIPLRLPEPVLSPHDH